MSFLIRSRAPEDTPPRLILVDAPTATQVKTSWIEGIVDGLLDPVGRARRAEALKGLRRRPTAGPSGASVPVTKPAYRRGWVSMAVTEVLTAAGGPMQVRSIHAATEELTGGTVAWSTVRSCLVENLGGKTPRFERVGRGCYRIAPGA